MRYNPPPNWPAPPPGWQPDPSWAPDPSWPPAPPGWQLWIDDTGIGAPHYFVPPPRTGTSTGLVVTIAVVCSMALIGLVSWGIYEATRPARWLNDLGSSYSTYDYSTYSASPNLSGTYSGTSVGSWSVTLTVYGDDDLDGSIVYTATNGTTCYGTWTQSSVSGSTYYVDETYPSTASSSCDTVDWAITASGTTLYANVFGTGSSMTLYRN